MPSVTSVFRVACYFLGPHNFVALCLAKRFRDSAAGGALRFAFLGLAAAQILADFASCFALISLLKQAYDDGDDANLRGL